MRPLRLAALLALASAIAAVVAVTVSGSHGPQLWAGQWNYSYPGVSGGFAFRHETDTNGAELLEALGGVACPEPTDYFAGGYTIPDEPPPDEPYIDTGKIRGCTVDDDPRRLQGRYQSNSNPNSAGSFDITLDSTNERWTGTYQPDGAQEAQAWTGFFDNHFADGAEDVSDPPYGQTTPDEPEPGGGAPPPPPTSDLTRCLGKEATITPNPGAPPGLAIQGTTSDDVIVGTNGPDRILALGGSDIVCGFGGDDEIIGAEGGDQIYGGDGNDTLDGGPGEDQLFGEAGNDQLLGGAERSYLEGGAGNDRLVGGEAGDELYGGFAHLLGQPENLVAGADDDDLRGEGGNDALFGEVGTDRLEGDGGNDRMDGGDGGEQKVGDVFGDVTSYFRATRGVQVNVRPGRVTGGLGADAIRGIESGPRLAVRRRPPRHERTGHPLRRPRGRFHLGARRKRHPRRRRPRRPFDRRSRRRLRVRFVRVRPVLRRAAKRLRAPDPRRAEVSRRPAPPACPLRAACAALIAYAAIVSISGV